MRNIPKEEMDRINASEDPLGSLMGYITNKIDAPTAVPMPAMPVEQQPKQESMAMPALSMGQDTVENLSISEAQEETNPYVIDISDFEGWHGGVPKITKDRSEADKGEEEKSRDIGFGHKLTDAEEESGYIHGIRFKDSNGNNIPITKKQGLQILREDIKENLRVARADVEGEAGWDTKLEAIGASWEEIDPRYQNALSSLAMNVGGTKAGREWTYVLQAAANENVQLFAKEMRRLDGGKHTDAMDNRVAKELYRAGIIESFDEVASVLPLADARVAGVPRTILAQK